MNHTRYAELGQNRIDYIVYHNILEAQKLLYDQGFESPEDPEDVVEAIKELVRQKGREVIEALLKIHPDKKAILSIADISKLCENCKTTLGQSKKQGCTSCTKKTASLEDNFTEEPRELDSNARLHYLITKHKANPTDTELEKEIEALWNTIRTKPEKAIEKQTTNQRLLTKNELCIYASIFGIGVLMGWGFSYSKNS
ncbi:hypothetical protein [uncultured Dokdonia sp.]|uniref:hypothetical protein n=1 Tax=uncultured Dokdonia sp. TaxID=575653 RepID=UPI00260FE851|nr:hypothetical protein [uncultured Dokdonia sp.]